jgi:hypothetical protein
MLRSRAAGRFPPGFRHYQVFDVWCFPLKRRKPANATLGNNDHTNHKKNGDARLGSGACRTSSGTEGARETLCEACGVPARPQNRERELDQLISDRRAIGRALCDGALERLFRVARLVGRLDATEDHKQCALVDHRAVRTGRRSRRLWW